MPHRATPGPNPQSSGVEPRTTPQESGHQNPNHDDHPQSDSTPQTGADESGRKAQSDTDEDSRARRRDV